MKKFILLVLLPALMLSCFNPKQIQVLSHNKPVLNNMSISGVDARIGISVENKSSKNIILEKAVIKVKNLNTGKNMMMINLLSGVELNRKNVNDINLELKINYSTEAVLEFVAKGANIGKEYILNNMVADADITAVIGNKRKSFTIKDQRIDKIINSKLYQDLFIP